MNFISEISLFFLLPVIILAAFLTWFFYAKDEKLKELPQLYRRLVYGARFLVLTLIGFLLLGILFEFTKTRSEKPILITVFDNSASLKNYKDSSEVLNRINLLKGALKTIPEDKYDQVTYTIGEDFKNSSEVNLKEGKSDLSKAFESLFSDYYNRNIGGIIFVSDGNFNEGQNPVYAASKIPLTPVFTIGVGDTVSKKDQVLKDVICNEIAFLKNKFPVEVDLEAFKIGKRNVTVSISQNGKTLASQQVNYTDGTYDSKQLIFELEASHVGFQHFVAEVKAVDNEYTIKNNRRSFYVEVLDARSKILLLYGAPHPDISAVKSVLEQDENIQVEAQSLEKWDKNLKNVDLIIWHEPGIAFSDNVNQEILASKIPVFYFVGVNTSNSVAQKLSIGLNSVASQQQDEVQADIQSGFEKFELSDELKSEIGKFPPVTVRYGTPKIGNQNEILLSQKIAGISKKDPLLYFGSIDKRKYAVFLGDGVWRWKMSEYLKFKSNKLFNEFIQKSSLFLIQKENSSNLRVSMPKRFSINEDVLIKAEFYNESMELITKPKISFNLFDSRGKKSVFEFGVNGNLYLLPLGKLKPGTYSWTASTSFDGKKYSKQGNFVVENIEIEKLDTRANHGLLAQIASQSKGKFYLLKDYQQLIKEIQDREDITSISYQESSFDNLLDYVWILILICLLLSGEWFIKRWNGYY
ncbi:MAG: hypothetical protein K0R65_250 [Crocinitomicaceae bacterium]|jgi:hypothetical protein|nr:hypothetical protein [Crocinitomicaceae bacterium]